MRAALKDRPAPPADEAALLERARGLAGRTIAELGAARQLQIPADARHAKGLVGSLVEWHLGADAGSRAEPDLSALGIEIKTIPLDRTGKPRESTFVCSIRLQDVAEMEWEDSRARKKLARVLWVPVESDPDLALGDRRIGSARLWSPSPQEEAALRADWEELAGIIGRGDVQQITAHLGRYLQVRPKAAHGRVLGKGRDAAGAPLATLPRGFYLRATFTARLFSSTR